MDFKTFARIIDELKNVSERTTKAYKINVDLIDYNDDFYNIITTLIDELFTEESVDWIDWYMFEKDFGRDKNMEAWDENRNPICRNTRELYKLMKYKKHD